jgi:acyl-CoA thioester hydrolase
MARIFAQGFTVGAESIDLNGHVNNQEYVRWMQDAAIAHSDAQGWTLPRYAAAGRMWVIRSHYIEYVRPAFKGDGLVVATWPAEFDQRSARRKYRFVRQKDGKIVVDALSVWVYCDARTGRPAVITNDLRDAFPIVTQEAEIAAAIAGAVLESKQTPMSAD